MPVGPTAKRWRKLRSKRCHAWVIIMPHRRCSSSSSESVCGSIWKTFSGDWCVFSIACFYVILNHKIYKLNILPIKPLIINRDGPLHNWNINIPGNNDILGEKAQAIWVITYLAWKMFGDQYPKNVDNFFFLETTRT